MHYTAEQQINYLQQQMCIQFVRTALHRRGRVVKPPWVQKTKVRNTSNTQSHKHTRSSTHPLTHRPNHPPTTCYSNTAECSSRCVDINRVAVTLGFPCFYDSPPSRRASDPSPEVQRTTIPARRVGHGTPYAPETENGCCVGGT